MDTKDSPYESPLGRAIDLLRNGYSLPFTLRRDLTEQGFDVLALEAAHRNQKS